MQKKKQFTIRMPTDLYEQMQRCIGTDASRSQVQFINNAVRMYIGQLNAQQGEDYLSKTMLSVIHAGQNKMVRAVCSVLYALAVELNILQRILMMHFEVPEELCAELRRDARGKVKVSRDGARLEQVQQELFGGDDESQS